MNRPAVTLDATFVAAYCANEAGRAATVVSEITNYAKQGYEFHAPGVIVAECMFAFCRMVADGRLRPTDGDLALARFVAFMRGIEPNADGDAPLASRSVQIRSSYGCSRTSDAIYLALAERLATEGSPDLLTFDAGMTNQARSNAPTVNVRVF